MLLQISSQECSEVIRDQLFIGGIKVAMDPDIIMSKGIHLP